MQMKLLIAVVDADGTDRMIDSAREAGAAGATLIHQARGEGRRGLSQFLGLSLDACRDVLLFIVPVARADHIIEHIASEAAFDETPGTGVVFQLDVEDSVGLRHQVRGLNQAGPSEADP